MTNHSKWNLEDFRQEGFIDKVSGNMLHLAYDGYDPDLDKVPLEHARWFAGLVSQLLAVAAAPRLRGRGRHAGTGRRLFTTKLAEKIGALKAVK